VSELSCILFNTLKLAMVVTMTFMWKMELLVYQIIYMIAVVHNRVPTIRAMRMFFLITF